jgi:apolipoprotein D and lipocalin family protein
VDTRTVVVGVPPARAFEPVRRIGGAAGWYFGNLLWKARGWLDRRLGGVAMGRGRRDAESCTVGDVIDGWTVEAYEPDRRLRLSADLKLPGRGWLEFEVTPLDGGRRSTIRQTATFDPRGLLGRAYWYAILPLHAMIFRGLLLAIAARAERGHVHRAATAGLPRVRPRSRDVRRLLSWTLGVMSVTRLMIAPVEARQVAPVRTVETVNLDRYVGDWFEIARFPNRFQRSCVGDVRASYTRRADRRIDVVNRCRTADGVTEARGVARVVDSRTSAKLKVRFAPAALAWLPFVWGDYWILGLADDYSWAVVGSPDREYLWILARTAALDGDRFESALRAVRGNGFDPGRLVKTSHSASRSR